MKIVEKRVKYVHHEEIVISTIVRGVRKIVPEENSPPVRVRVWFRISVRIRAGGQFSSGAIFLEPL